ncbi:MAG TPA: cytochrome c oxidase subunit II [Candidatus Acidoferrum sp.]|nr:cytochrome c oxidase subunit II [Candidatus Acidoferrum sp.]
MSLGFRLLPEQASTIAGQVDALLLFLTAVSAIFAGLIFLTLIFFAIKYRRRSEKERPRPIHGSLPLEIVWTVIPLGLTMIMFGWGAWLYFSMSRPPADAMEIFVVGKQWMWKLQHPDGQREINELHVPVGRPVKLTMTSEDTIHSFFVPEFRVKKDVVPGRYSTVWFQATKPGEYHLFCTQYCGTSHSNMIGRIVVMPQDAFQDWLRGGGAGVPLAVAGEKLFQQLACISCHVAGGGGVGPTLVGVFGKPVKLTTGQTVIADEAYIRESILDPPAKIVAGYAPVMPPFKGQVSEDQLLQLLAYIKSLATEEKAKAQ